MPKTIYELDEQHDPHDASFVQSIQICDDLSKTRPEMAKWLGGIVAAWGAIDSDLDEIFNLAASPYDDSDAPQIREIAHIVFEDVRSYHQRVKMLKKVLAQQYGQPLRDEFAKIGNQIEKKSARRNELVHACWGTSPRYPEELIAFNPSEILINIIDRDVGAFDTALFYIEDDFLAVLEMSIKLREQTHAFAGKMWTQEKTKSAAAR